MKYKKRICLVEELFLLMSNFLGDPQNCIGIDRQMRVPEKSKKALKKKKNTMVTFSYLSEPYPNVAHSPCLKRTHRTLRCVRLNVLLKTIFI